VSGNIAILFLPMMLFAILAEILVLQARHETYNWSSAGVSVLVAIGQMMPSPIATIGRWSGGSAAVLLS
jgi:hypothetical protein